MYLSQGNNNSAYIEKLIKEKQDLSKKNLDLTNENLDLKNDLLILKNQIKEDDEENDNYNITENNGSDSNKAKEMEEYLEEMEKKFGINLNMLKIQDNENQNLLSDINKDIKPEQENNNAKNNSNASSNILSIKKNSNIDNNNVYSQFLTQIKRLLEENLNLKKQNKGIRKSKIRQY